LRSSQEALSTWAKRPALEADYSLPNSAWIKNEQTYTFISQYTFMVWCLINLRNNLPACTVSHLFEAMSKLIIPCLKFWLPFSASCLMAAVQRRIVGRLMSDELERIWKERIVA
jgi:hypothetical protein